MAKFQVFRDGAGEYSWRLHADDNTIIAYSAESYARELDCRRGIELVKILALISEVEDEI